MVAMATKPDPGGPGRGGGALLGGDLGVALGALELWGRTGAVGGTGGAGGGVGGCQDVTLGTAPAQPRPWAQLCPQEQPAWAQPVPWAQPARAQSAAGTVGSPGTAVAPGTATTATTVSPGTAGPLGTATSLRNSWPKAQLSLGTAASPGTAGSPAHAVLGHSRSLGTVVSGHSPPPRHCRPQALAFPRLILAVPTFPVAARWHQRPRPGQQHTGRTGDTLGWRPAPPPPPKLPPWCHPLLWGGCREGPRNPGSPCPPPPPPRPKPWGQRGGPGRRGLLPPPSAGGGGQEGAPPGPDTWVPSARPGPPTAPDAWVPRPPPEGGEAETGRGPETPSTARGGERQEEGPSPT